MQSAASLQTGILVVRCCDESTSLLIKSSSEWRKLLGIPGDIETIELSDLDARDATSVLVLKRNRVYLVPSSRWSLAVQVVEPIVHCYLIMQNAMTSIQHMDWIDTNTSVLDNLSIKDATSLSSKMQDWHVSSCYLSSLPSKPFGSLERRVSLDQWSIWVRNESMTETWHPVLFQDI